MPSPTFFQQHNRRYSNRSDGWPSDIETYMIGSKNNPMRYFGHTRKSTGKRLGKHISNHNTVDKMNFRLYEWMREVGTDTVWILSLNRHESVQSFAQARQLEQVETDKWIHNGWIHPSNVLNQVRSRR